MGVPMLRPTTPSGSSGSSSVQVLNPAWLDISSFCSISDLSACLAVDRHWRAVVDTHHVWADAYARTQRVDDSSAPSGENLLRSLIERPFGEDAVGWHVAVLAEDNTYGAERHYTGRVMAYSADTDTYLIAYDSDSGQDQPNMHWEQERRKRTAAMRHNPSLAGKSRFSFLSPPANLPKTGAVSSSSMARAEPSDKAERDEMRPRAPLLGSWKEELKHNVLHAPNHKLAQLKEHSDEVLFVVFSPCGTRLASCSRDLRTVVFKVQNAVDVQSSSSHDWKDVRPGSARRQSSRSWPTFEREAVFTHQTAPCRAMWWPIPPFDMVAVSTEDAGAGWQASKVEIWQIDPDASEQPSDSEEQLPVGFNAQCIFQCHNRPFDIYAAILHWPPMLAEPGGTESPKDDYDQLCFLAGWAVLRENEHYVQWLNVWPGPRHPSFQDAQANSLAGSNGNTPRPLARLRLEGEMNYLHCLEVGPPDKLGRQQILAMTGSTPHLCNEIGLMDLSGLQRRGEGPEGPTQEGEAAFALPAVYDVGVKVYSMGERVVLSAKWNGSGDFILLNTRPYAHAAGSSKNSGEVNSQAQPPQGGATFEDLLLRPAPDLSTKMELLLLDATTLDVLSVFDGHFAFTTKESPFLIFTEEWSDSDFLASGGEDHRVYIWHRRHGRLIRRLCGHAEPVNAVSWNGRGLLASASDDNSIIIWAAAGAKVPS